jgi:hypothetical protein
VVHHETIKGDPLEDLGAHIGIGETLRLSRPHLLLASLRDLIGIVKQDRVLCVKSEKTFQVAAIVGIQLGLDDGFW